MNKHNILRELPTQTRMAVRLLNSMMHGKGMFDNIADREQQIDMLKETISDTVLTILMKEDDDKLDYFLKNK
jgi:hypothetical protein